MSKKKKKNKKNKKIKVVIPDPIIKGDKIIGEMPNGTKLAIDLSALIKYYNEE